MASEQNLEQNASGKDFVSGEGPPEIILQISNKLSDKDALSLGATCTDLQFQQYEVIKRNIDQDRDILIQAATNGLVDTLGGMLREMGEDELRRLVNEPLFVQDMGNTFALHLAVWNGQDAMVVALLNLGARVDNRDCHYATALHCALDDRCARLLVAAGAPLNAFNEHGESPIAAIICSAGRYAAEIMGEADLGEPKVFSGRKAFEAVAYLANFAGANLNIGAGSLSTPVGQAVFWEMHDILVVLLARNARVPAVIFDGDTIMQTMIMSLDAHKADSAGYENCLRVIDALVSAGADVKDLIHGLAEVLHDHDHAHHNGLALAIAQCALLKCENVDVQDTRGRTALMIAMQRQHVHMTEMLIDFGADKEAAMEWVLDQQRWYLVCCPPSSERRQKMENIFLS